MKRKLKLTDTKSKAIDLRQINDQCALLTHGRV